LVGIQEFNAGLDQGFLNRLQRTDPRIHNALFQPRDGVQRGDPLGRTTGLLRQRHFGNEVLALDEPVVVLTCDNVVELDFELLEKSYVSLNSPACMLVPVKPIPGLDGDYVFHENHVVTEISRLKETDIYCSGIQVLNPCRVNEVTHEGENFYDVWQQLINQQELFVSSVYPKKWFAVDTIEQLTALNQTPF